MSTPLKTSGPSARSRTGSRLNVMLFPAERADAKARSSRTGNFRSSRILRVVCPTAPVTPTTATTTPEAMTQSILSIYLFQYDFSTSARIKSPISDVPTSLVPAEWMSRVRCPRSSTRSTAASTRPPSPPSPPGRRDPRPCGVRAGGEPLPALHRHVERGPGHPLDLARGVGHGVDRARASVGELLAPAGLAEVEPAGQLADHHDVGALDDRPLEGRGVHQHREAGRRAQVGEEVELLADAEEPALGTLLLRQRVPLGAPHRPEEDRVRLLAEREGRGRQRSARRVDGRAAHEPALELEPDAGGTADEREDALRLRRHLLPDAVAGQHCDLVGRHVRFSGLARSGPGAPGPRAARGSRREPPGRSRSVAAPRADPWGRSGPRRYRASTGTTGGEWRRSAHPGRPAPAH